LTKEAGKKAGDACVQRKVSYDKKQKTCALLINENKALRQQIKICGSAHYPPDGGLIHSNNRLV
jgi:hypothetical protein